MKKRIGLKNAEVVSTVILNLMTIITIAEKELANVSTNHTNQRMQREVERMSESKYVVIMGGSVVATEMTLADACILIKGLAEAYYMEMECGGCIELREMQRNVGCADNEID